MYMFLQNLKILAIKNCCSFQVSFIFCSIDEALIRLKNLNLSPNNIPSTFKSTNRNAFLSRSGPLTLNLSLPGFKSNFRCEIQPQRRAQHFLMHLSHLQSIQGLFCDLGVKVMALLLVVLCSISTATGCP